MFVLLCRLHYNLVHGYGTLNSSVEIFSCFSQLHTSPNNVRVIKSRIMRWAGHVALMGDRRGVLRVLVGKPEGKRPLGRPRPRWEDNIKMELQEVGYWSTDWIELAQDRNRWQTLVNAVMKFRVP